MNVKNRKCIRKLSLKSLYANRRRNLIAIFAIALTTLLFTSMFTIVLSLNASYETYQFRQVGGYAHGTFKDVSPEQAERIAAHPKVKAAGARKVIGITADGVFAKIPAEISYMDANCTKWSYATPTTGRMPESGKEVAMDTAALQLLGVTPELGAEVTVSYSITDKDQTAFTVTDTFTLVGYWDYDELMPVHYINISRDYADDIEAQAVKTGLQPFRTDLNVMLASGTNIQGQMEQVDTDLGYTWDSYTDPNSVRIGVNWGYTSSQLESQLDPELMIAIAAFLLLVIFTGYLIIYNIFQISVAGDIRFYGLLKTIGTTPRQLKTHHSPAGTSALSDRHSGGAAVGLWHWRCSGACCLALHPVGCRHHHHQHFACDLRWLHAVCLVDGAFVLFQARKNGSQGFLRWRLPNIQMRCRPRKNSAAPGSEAPSDGLCQSGTKQEKDGAGGVVSGTVGDTVQCAVCLCGRLQHGEVCILHDLRRFYRQHSRLFPLQPGR